MARITRTRDGRFCKPHIPLASLTSPVFRIIPFTPPPTRLSKSFHSCARRISRNPRSPMVRGCATKRRCAREKVRRSVVLTPLTSPLVLHARRRLSPLSSPLSGPPSVPPESLRGSAFPRPAVRVSLAREAERGHKLAARADR